MDLADDFTASTAKPPTREEALAAATELEQFIGRLIAGEAKPGDMPSRPPVVLISYARTATLEQDLITAEKQVGELHGRLKQKHNLLELASNALKLSTELAKESDARNKRLRAALQSIVNDEFGSFGPGHVAKAALDADDAQREADNTIAVDPTGALFGGAAPVEHHGLDNDDQVFFYEHDFYVLSNFSAFNLEWEGLTFQTSEAAYHWEKFACEHDDQTRNGVALAIYEAPSAHAAFKLAEAQKHLRRPDWDEVKVDIMLRILRAKAEQHEYVRRKLLATGYRELIENSWRDAFWGWGPNRDGQNMLGKLWMRVRTELREGVSHG